MKLENMAEEFTYVLPNMKVPRIEIDSVAPGVRQNSVFFAFSLSLCIN